MKKINILLVVATLVIISWACKKSSDTPSIAFSATALDSVKVSTLDSLTVVGIKQNHIDSFFVTVLPNTPTSVYQRTLYFTYTGGGDFTVIYTGDSTHIYNPQNANTLTDSITSTAATFNAPFFSYKYSNAGSYTVTAVASNVKNFGSDIYRGVFSQTYIIK